MCLQTASHSTAHCSSCIISPKQFIFIIYTNNFEWISFLILSISINFGSFSRYKTLLKVTYTYAKWIYSPKIKQTNAHYIWNLSKRNCLFPFGLYLNFGDWNVEIVSISECYYHFYVSLLLEQTNNFFNCQINANDDFESKFFVDFSFASCILGKM